jgi:hypothetical protein
LNQENEWGFLLPYKEHSIPLPGREYPRSIPCLKMYDESAKCPLCEVSRKEYKRAKEENLHSTEHAGRDFYRRLSWRALVLVVEDGVPKTEDSPEYQGKVLWISLGKSLFKMIEQELANDWDALPYDPKHGCDFIIRKSKKIADGREFAEYTGTFARRSRALTEEELQVVQESLVDFRSTIPPKPAMEDYENIITSYFNVGDDEEEESVTEKVKETTGKVVEASSKVEEPQSSFKEEDVFEDSIGSDDLDDALSVKRGMSSSEESDDPPFDLDDDDDDDLDEEAILNFINKR